MKDKLAVWSSDGRGSLEFSEPRSTRSAFRCTATLVIDGEPSSVELEMITPHRLASLDFFRDLVGHLDGWERQKVWRSEFSEMSLSFANDGSGSIVMDVLMQWAPTYDPERRGTLAVDPKDIVRICDELPDFLRLPPELR